MKVYGVLLYLGLAVSCSKVQYRFMDVTCEAISCPDFDYKRVSIVNDEGKFIKDTIIEKTAKRCNVFRPCQRYIYRAIYKDSLGRVISTNHISLMATGRRWKLQPENQNEIVIQYEHDEKTDTALSRFNINRQLKLQSPFVKEETTGAIENAQEVWMHPFRSNQYNFTEVAPFPHVTFPLQVGNSWSSSLTIGNGWGDWDNTTVYCEYLVAREIKMKVAKKGLKKCWLIESKANMPLGISTHNFYFNEEYGFVKMEYRNYAGQTLYIELVAIAS